MIHSVSRFFMIHSVSRILWFNQYLVLYDSLSISYCMIYSVSRIVWFTQYLVLYDSLSISYCMIHSVSRFLWFIQYLVFYDSTSISYCMIHSVSRIAHLLCTLSQGLGCNCILLQCGWDLREKQFSIIGVWKPPFSAAATFRRVHRIPKSDYYLRHVCLSIFLSS